MLNRVNNYLRMIVITRAFDCTKLISWHYACAGKHFPVFVVETWVSTKHVYGDFLYYSLLRLCLCSANRKVLAKQISESQGLSLYWLVRPSEVFLRKMQHATHVWWQLSKTKEKNVYITHVSTNIRAFSFLVFLWYFLKYITLHLFNQTTQYLRRCEHGKFRCSVGLHAWVMLWNTLH